MVIFIMNFDEPIMRVEFSATSAKSEWLGQKHIKIPRYMYPENITSQAVSRFCETRQPPRTRFNIDDILKKYNLKEYLPIQMCKISHGVTHSDDLWIWFEGQERYKYADIRVR